MKLSRIGIDLAKNVFQVHGVDRHEKTMWRRRLRRDQWLRAVWDRAEPGWVMAMEACGGAQHGARELQSRPLCRQIDTPPQLVKPYVRSNQNDAHDATTIGAAMSRANMRFVAVRRVEQRDIQAPHRIRAERVAQRSAQGNQIPGPAG